MEYFMESAGVLYLRTSCWRIQKQRVRKFRTKHIPCGTVFIELFWKNSSYVSGVRVCIFVALYLCIFVTLYVRMFVARANKVEGTMSWCLGTNEILAST